MEDIVVTGGLGAAYGFLLSWLFRIALHYAFRKEGRTSADFAAGVAGMAGTVDLALISLWLSWVTRAYVLGISQPYGVWVFWLFWQDLKEKPATRQKPLVSLAKAVTLSLVYLLISFYRLIDSLLGRKPPGR